jgi:Flp pilus assembly protein TadG
MDMKPDLAATEAAHGAKNARRTRSSERGAILVQVAISGLVLLGFSAFVMDFGVLWLAREQAQNAADAGAMAGALARAYDSDEPPAAGGIADLSASQVANANLVLGESATPVVSFDCPGGLAAGRCVRVDVYRNGQLGSTPLPTFFGPVIGIMSQGVRATATAQVSVGNSTTCLRPLAVPDRWIENSVPADNSFVRYVDGTGVLVPNPDAYVAPDAGGPGSGLTFAADLGTSTSLTFGDQTALEPITPFWYLPLDIQGPNSYYDNITGCGQRRTAEIGQQISTADSTIAVEGLTTASFAQLIAQDAGASWNAATDTIQGSCAPVCAPISPRLMAIAVFDVDRYQLRRATGDWSGCPRNEPCVDVVNIIGFFADSIAGSGDLNGYVARHPGLVSVGAPAISAESSFLMAMTLVR